MSKGKQLRRRATIQGVKAQQQATQAESKQDSHDARLTPERVLTLQGQIGNQAVQRMLAEGAAVQTGVLQRGDPTIDFGEDVISDTPLTPAQAAHAQSYYRGRPDYYTESIISQIRTAVGLDAAGGIDSEMVQAVAKWQQEQGTLAVDGMAGPRTLPALFASGLATDANMDAFVDASKEMQGRWSEFTSAEERRAEMERLVNARLDEAGVFNLSLIFADTGAAAAQFDYSGWNMEIGRESFEGESVDDHTMAELANSMLHEARHAEQWYSIAAMLAGKGWSAEDIHTETEIETRAIADAIRPENQIAPGTMEALIAQGWYDSVYGRDSQHRDGVLRRVLAAKAALNAAEQALEDDPDNPATIRAHARANERFQAAYTEYRDLPEENDAFRVGDEVGIRFLLAELGEEELPEPTP